MIVVNGVGAVSPAGWSKTDLHDVVKRNESIPTKSISRPGWEKPFAVRQVPPPSPRPAFFSHPRLRRADLISQYTVAAALEALGDDAARVQNGSLRLGIVVCVMAGGVAYSRRFYEETLQDPAIASPLVFSETVFNAPASHLAAYLNSPGPSYTLVGDDGTFLQGLALAADWLLNDQTDGCVVVGAEEMDWIVTDAMRLFQRDVIHSDGAGALYLNVKPGMRNAEHPIELGAITDSFLFTKEQTRFIAAKKMRSQLPPSCSGELLCASAGGPIRADTAEEVAWRDWQGSRLALKKNLGEAFTASVAWQCVAACEALRQGTFSAANVSVIGANQQAIGARFTTAGG